MFYVSDILIAHLHITKSKSDAHLNFLADPI